jgi:esterase
VSAVKLNYKILGEKGFPIVILHGLFGMLDNWQTIGKKLVDYGYRVYLIDQRDHGKSPFTDEFNYDILAQDLQLFLDENDLFKIYLIGHSMGGKVAMQFALDHPFYLDKLVVVDIWNRTYSGGHEVIFKAINEMDIHNIENRNFIYDHLKTYNLDEGTIQFLLKNLQRRSEGGYDWKMNYRLLQKNYESILDKVGKPDTICEIDSLFIKGSLSSYIKKSDYNDIIIQFPNANIVEIPDAGHWIHADKPAEMVDVLLRFLYT